MWDFIWYILIGAFAGFLAGKITKGSGFGFWINLIVGIIGGVIGGWVFGLFGLGSESTIGNLIMSVVGAIILLFLISLISKKK